MKIKQVFLSAFLTAWLTSATAAYGVSQQKFCRVLKAAIAASPSGFANVKGARDMDAWHTTILPFNIDDGMTCLILPPGVNMGGRLQLAFKAINFHCKIYGENMSKVDHRVLKCLTGWNRGAGSFPGEESYYWHSGSKTEVGVVDADGTSSNIIVLDESGDSKN